MSTEGFENLLSVALTSVGQIFPEKAILVFNMASKGSSLWKAKLKKDVVSIAHQQGIEAEDGLVI